MDKQNLNENEEPKELNIDFFDELFFTYHNYIFRTIQNTINSQSLEDAEDILQEVFIRALERKDQLANHTNVQFWLIRTAKNLSMNYNTGKRINSKRFSPFDNALDDIADNMDIEMEVFEKLEWEQYMKDGILDNFKSILNEKERTLYNLKFEQGLKNEEVARIMGINAPTVNTRCLRLKKKIKSYIRKKYKSKSF